MLWYYSRLLHRTALGWALGGGVPWLWPLFQVLHLLGMTLVLGCVVTIDLRMLGIGKGLPVGPLRRLLPWGILGFAMTLLTGFGFYAGNPEPFQNWAFAAKMGFIGLAGVNALLYYATGLHRRVRVVDAGQDVPLAAKALALSSLVLWFGVMFWGRMLPFFSSSS
jgi:hypothetical protein